MFQESEKLSVCKTRHYFFKDPCRTCEFNEHGCKDRSVHHTITILQSKGVLNDGTEKQEGSCRK